MALIDKLNAIGDAIRSKTGKTGKMTLDEMPTQIASIEGGGAAPTPTQEKTIDIKINGTVEVTPDEGYALSKVTANVDVPIPDGYIVPSGTKEITENGTFDVTVYDSVNVNVSTGGGDSEEFSAFLENTLQVLDNSSVTTLRTRVCQAATKLTTVNLPNVTTLGAYAFYQCSNLKTVTLPKLTTISTQTWYMCQTLERADCGQLGNVSAQTFASCAALKTLILRKTSDICTLSNANGVSGSGIGKGTGYVYVPSALIDTYKTATNWSTYADQFRAIEDYPEICGG